MDEPSPTEPLEGQEPEGREGQEPASNGEPTPQEGEGRTYAESYVKQLRRENAASRSRLSELEERLQEFEDRDKSELELAEGRATTAEKALADERSYRMRVEVATEKGLSLEATKFLTGSTREEIELRAEELAALLADSGRPPTAGFDGGARTPVPELKTPEEAHNELLLRSLGRGRG
jgi:hypothetical protein